MKTGMVADAEWLENIYLICLNVIIMFPSESLLNKEVNNFRIYIFSASCLLLVSNSFFLASFFYTYAFTYIV